MLEELVQEVDVHGKAKGTVSFEGFLEIVVRLQGTSYDSHGEMMQVFIFSHSTKIYMFLVSYEFIL